MWGPSASCGGRRLEHCQPPTATILISAPGWMTYCPRREPIDRGRRRRPSRPSGGIGRTSRSGCGPSWCRLLGCQYMRRISVPKRHTQRAVLPVPYPNRLVVAGADDPGELVVEEDSSDVVQMAVQGEQTSPGLVGPDLDLVVIASGDEEWLPPVSLCPLTAVPKVPPTCVLWKSTPRTGPSCSSNLSINVPMR